MAATRDVNKNRTYRAFQNMRARCKGKYEGHSKYIERGITCDPVWFNSYDQFLADMGECPEGMTLDREDNDKGYSKENCRWADYHTQTNNRSNNVRVEHQGETLTLGQWSNRLGIPYDTLYARIQRMGWSVVRAFNEPVHKKAIAA